MSQAKLIAEMLDVLHTWRADVRSKTKALEAQLKEAMEAEGLEEVTSASSWKYQKLNEPITREYTVRDINRIDIMKELKDAN